MTSNKQATGPSQVATVIIVLGSMLSIVPALESWNSLQDAAIIMAVSIALALWLEVRRSFFNLIRADIVILLALYGLLYLEFLLPKGEFSSQDYPSMVATVAAIGLGFASIALGRHIQGRRSTLHQRTKFDMPRNVLFNTLLSCAAVGSFSMLLSVSFNPVALFEAMTGPRFSQPWTRGRLGGWSELLGELSLLLYIVPPLCAVILARWRSFGLARVCTASALLAFVLFQGFASGARNLFAIYLLSFAVSYVLTKSPMRPFRIGSFLLAIAGILFFANAIMLGFRGEGLAGYVNGETQIGDADSSGVFIDNNIYTLSLVVDAFSISGNYLGLEVPFWALIKIIPRALWSGKPEGLSTPIEMIRTSEDDITTWATTFVGEAFMAGSHIAVFAFGLLFGSMASWWSALIRGPSTDFQKIVYASGIFAFLITVRSMFWFTTGILPAVALIVYGTLSRDRRALPST